MLRGGSQPAGSYILCRRRLAGGELEGVYSLAERDSRGTWCFFFLQSLLKSLNYAESPMCSDRDSNKLETSEGYLFSEYRYVHGLHSLISEEIQTLNKRIIR